MIYHGRAGRLMTNRPMSNTPINPLDYATPELNRRKTRWWFWPILAVLVPLLAISIGRYCLGPTGGSSRYGANLVVLV